ncbi:unnamed protein product [Gongylonema pulchrum]|uniref:SH3 domain-containing protein n=1 Tax=Gongylonema pulchrum TaxID=637853 RepID=A0A183E5G4_9BILA|nr:unnamed protein product [Gongylonema pulchrum]
MRKSGRCERLLEEVRLNGTYAAPAHPGNFIPGQFASTSAECAGEVRAVMNSSFKAVKKKQISGHRGERVTILSVEQGYAEVEKEDGSKGYVPTYFLDLDTVPGDNFGDQIRNPNKIHYTPFPDFSFRYRRKWYRLLDNAEAATYEDNPSNLLDNIGYLTALTSFFPTAESEQRNVRALSSPRDHKRPICIEPLQDMTTKVNEKIILQCKFYSEEAYTVIWKGPAIAAGRSYDVRVTITHSHYCRCYSEIIDHPLKLAPDRTDKDGHSILTLRNCLEEDAGQYWAQAKNVFGKCHSVAWIAVITEPGCAHITLCKALHRTAVLLQWKRVKSGNSKNVFYAVQYKRKGILHITLKF